MKFWIKPFSKGFSKGLIGVLAIGLVIMQIIPTTVIAMDSFEMKHIYKGFGANQTQNQTNGSQYLQGVANRVMILLGIIGGVIIAVLWVKVAIEFFSEDPQKKAMAKEHMLHALIGTIIIAMAVGGAIWLIARWIAGA